MSGGGSTIAQHPLLRHAHASGDRIRRRVLEATGFDDIFDLNTTLTIKSSPPKTVKSLECIAIKSGICMKRTEQLEWLERQCLVVPHTFLYYFSPENPTHPQGIIDLENYTDFEVQEGLVLKLSAEIKDEEEDLPGGRDFFFSFSSEEDLAEWISDLSSGCRYADAVRRRNLAVRQSEELTKRVAALTSELERRDQDRSQRAGEVFQELSHTNAEVNMCLSQARALLESHSSTYTKNTCNSENTQCNQTGDVVHVGDLRQAMLALGELLQRLHRECAAEKARADTVEAAALERVASAEATKNAELEKYRQEVAAAVASSEEYKVQAVTALSETESLRQELAQARAELEESRANVGVLAASWRESQQQTRDLLDQRHLLVKGLRRDAVMAAAANERLANSCERLRTGTEGSLDFGSTTTASNSSNSPGGPEESSDNGARSKSMSEDSIMCRSTSTGSLCATSGICTDVHAPAHGTIVLHDLETGSASTVLLEKGGHADQGATCVPQPPTSSLPRTASAVVAWFINATSGNCDLDYTPASPAKCVKATDVAEPRSCSSPSVVVASPHPLVNTVSFRRKSAALLGELDEETDREGISETSTEVATCSLSPSEVDQRLTNVDTQEAVITTEVSVCSAELDSVDASSIGQHEVENSTEEETAVGDAVVSVCDSCSASQNSMCEECARMKVTASLTEQKEPSTCTENTSHIHTDTDTCSNMHTNTDTKSDEIKHVGSLTDSQPSTSSSGIPKNTGNPKLGLFRSALDSLERVATHMDAAAPSLRNALDSKLAVFGSSVRWGLTTPTGLQKVDTNSAAGTTASSDTHIRGITPEGPIV